MSKKPKEGAISRAEEDQVKDSASRLLDVIKKNRGSTVFYRIDKQTVIELPSGLSEAEKVRRIENFKKNRGLI